MINNCLYSCYKTVIFSLDNLWTATFILFAVLTLFGPLYSLIIYRCLLSWPALIAVKKCKNVIDSKMRTVYDQ